MQQSVNSRETKPLKRPKLGPPDVYPQEEKQPEDELSEQTVSKGFLTDPVPDEYGTARALNLWQLSDKLEEELASIAVLRHKVNTLQDSGRRRQQMIQKEAFWMITPRTNRSHLEAWFMSLAGDKSSAFFGKRVPIFNKKEEILQHLCDFEVPLMRAVWFIKMSAAYAVSNSKRRPVGTADLAQEWTSAFVHFMRDLLLRLPDSISCSMNDSYQPSVPSYSMSSHSPAGNHLLTSHGNAHSPSVALGRSPSDSLNDPKICMRNWTYMQRLVTYFFQDGLVDRHQFLNWLLEQLQNSSDEKTFSHLHPFLMKYLAYFVQSLPLARNLATVCCEQLEGLLADEELLRSHQPTGSLPAALRNVRRGSRASISSQTTSAEKLETVSDGLRSRHSSNMSNSVSPLPLNGSDLFSSCPFHRSLLVGLSCTLQLLLLRCPTALVWMPSTSHQPAIATRGQITPGSSTSSLRDQPRLFGSSPLDQLRLFPSDLPTPSSLSPDTSRILRGHLRHIEERIAGRSSAAASRWCLPHSAHSEEAEEVKQLLSVLDIIDQHSFEQVQEKPGSVSTLFDKIFGHIQDQPIQSHDEVVVQLLCEWAITPQRRGAHRPLVVARLLRLRETNLSLSSGEVLEEDVDDDSSFLSFSGRSRPFQPLLVQFLDSRAAALVGDDFSTDGDTAFARLLHLFAEFCRQDLFSFQTYLCTLVARGDVMATPPLTPDSISARQSPHEPGMSNGRHGGMDESNGNGRSGSVDESQKLINKHLEDECKELWAFLQDEESKSVPQRSSAETAHKSRRLSHESDTSGAVKKRHLSQDSDTSLPPAKRRAAFLPATIRRLSGGGPLSTDHSSPRQLQVACHIALVLQLPLAVDECTEVFYHQRMAQLCEALGRQAEQTQRRQHMQEVYNQLMHYLLEVDSHSAGSVVAESSREDAVKAFLSLDCFHQRLLTMRCIRQLLPVLDGTFLPCEVQCTSPDRENVQTALPAFAELGTALGDISEARLRFLLELMLLCGDVSGMLDLIEHLLHGPVEEDDQKSCGKVTLPLRLAPLLISVLRQHHMSLVISHRQTCSVFAGLLRCLGSVEDVCSCTSEQLCVLMYLNHLYTNAQSLKVPFESSFDALSGQVGKLLSSRRVPGAGLVDNNEQAHFAVILSEMKAASQIHSACSRLSVSSSAAAAFVHAVMWQVCQRPTTQRLLALARVCAEVVSRSPGVSGELLGALRALCHPGKSLGFTQLLQLVELSQPEVQQHISHFVTYLVARQCLDLSSVLTAFVLPALQYARLKGTAAESGTRLIFHLLRCLLVGQTSQRLTSSLAYGSLVGSSWLPASEQLCMSALRTGLPLELVAQLLKSLLKLSHGSSGTGLGMRSIGAMATPLSGMPAPHVRQSMTPGVSTSSLGEMTDSDSNDDSDGDATSEPELKLPLATIASRTLEEICCQVWLRDQCLRRTDLVCSKEMLLDPVLAPPQAQLLLQLICYPEGTTSRAGHLEDFRETASRIMTNLDQWRLRAAAVELQLLIHQKQQASQLLDAIAHSAMTVFLSEQKHEPQNEHPKNEQPTDITRRKRLAVCSSVWLVAPLMAKLPPAVHGRMLKAAGDLLGHGTWWWRKPRGKSAMASWQKPFLHLVLVCLDSPGGCSEELLMSLQKQLSQFIAAPQEERCPDESEARHYVEEALRLRLSLVGALFNTVQRSSQSSADWAVLLLQLLASNSLPTDSAGRQQLVSGVIDMTAALLVDARYMSDQTGASSDEYSRRQSLPLLKRVKDLIASNSSDSVEECRCFLPIPQPSLVIPTVEEVVCVPTAQSEPSQTEKNEGKSQATAGCLDILARGFRFQGQQEVNSWDILDAQKGGPLSWNWFGAVRHDRKPSFYDEQSKQLVYHSHSKAAPLLPYQKIEVNMKVKDEEECNQDSKHFALIAAGSQPTNQQLPDILTNTPVSGLEAPFGVGLQQAQMAHPSGKLPQTMALPGMSYNQTNTSTSSGFGGDFQHVPTSSQPNTSAPGESLQQQQLFASYQKRLQNSFAGRSQYLLPGHPQHQQQVLVQQQQLASSSATHLQAQQSQAHYASMSRGSVGSSVGSSVSSGLYQHVDLEKPGLNVQSGQLAQASNLLVSPSKHVMPSAMQLLNQESQASHLYLSQQQLSSQSHQQQYQQLYRRS